MLNKYAIASLIGSSVAAPSGDQDYTKFPAFKTPVPVPVGTAIDATLTAVTADYVGGTATTPGYGPLRGFRNQIATFPTQTSAAITAASTATTAAVVTPIGTSRTFW